MKSKFLDYLIRESSSFKSKTYQNRNTHLCPHFYFDQFINGYFIPEKPIFGNFKVPIFAKLKKTLTDEYFFYLLLGCPRPNLGHCQGGSLTNPMLITAFDTYTTQRSRKPRNELGPKARPSTY